jgi:hypothetical protein
LKAILTLIQFSAAWRYGLMIALAQVQQTKTAANPIDSRNMVPALDHSTCQRPPHPKGRGKHDYEARQCIKKNEKLKKKIMHE